MAKVQALDGADLTPVKSRREAAMRQRGVIPSAELIPLQFKMPPAFVKAFKQAALDRDMKLNEFMNTIFDDFMKSKKV